VFVVSDGGGRASFMWEETGVPGGNPCRAGDDLFFPNMTPGFDSGLHW